MQKKRACSVKFALNDLPVKLKYKVNERANQLSKGEN